MFKRLIGVLAALTLAVGLTAGAAAAANHTHTEHHHVTVRSSTGAGHYSPTLWYKGNRRARTGHDLVWIKPTNARAAYHTSHYVFHPSLYCTPAGDLSYYVFRFYVWNPTSGYNHHQAIKVDCDAGSNSVTKGLTHFPRCYMVWDNDRNERSSCYLRVTVERVYFGPDPNGFDTAIGKIRIRPFHSINR